MIVTFKVLNSHKMILDLKEVVANASPFCPENLIDKVAVVSTKRGRLCRRINLEFYLNKDSSTDLWGGDGFVKGYTDKHFFVQSQTLLGVKSNPSLLKINLVPPAIET